MISHVYRALHYEAMSKAHFLKNIAQGDGPSIGNFQQKIIRVLQKVVPRKKFCNSKCSSAVLFFAVAAFFFIPYDTNAHIVPYMAIKTVLHAEGNTLRFKTEFGTLTAIKNIETAEREKQLEQIRAYYEDYFALLYGENPERSKPCSLLSVDDYRVDSGQETTTITGVYECPEKIEEIGKVYIVTDAFSDAFVRYDHYITLFVGGAVKDFILNQWVLSSFPLKQEIVDALFPEPEPGTINLARFEQPKIGQPQSTLLYVLKRFLRMGVEHILSGIDHILFLLSTIVLLTSVRRMLTLVTAFTIAHSITLILAGLGIVTLPNAVVEPFIAASIIFVTLWNVRSLWRGEERDFMRGRWVAAFGFGLVHGLGFAGALVDVDIPQRFFVPALLLFNVGVEVGQLAILAVVVPLLLLLYKKYQSYRRAVLLAFSVIITLIAFFWLLERLGIFETLWP